MKSPILLALLAGAQARHHRRPKREMYFLNSEDYAVNPEDMGKIDQF